MEKLVKIFIPLPENPKFAGENIWAIQIADKLFRIENSPFSAYGISYLDEVNAEFDIYEGRYVFKRVNKKSGHSTYRIMIKDKKFEKIVLDQILIHGVTYEGSDVDEILYSLDIENNDLVYKIYPILERLENEGKIIFEEADFALNHS